MNYPRLKYNFKDKPNCKKKKKINDNDNKIWKRKFNLESYYLRQKKNTEEIYQQAVERTQIL